MMVEQLNRTGNLINGFRTLIDNLIIGAYCLCLVADLTVEVLI